MSGKRLSSSWFKGAWVELICQFSKQRCGWYRQLIVIISELLYLPMYNVHPCIICTHILDCTLKKKKKEKWLRKTSVKKS